MTFPRRTVAALSLLACFSLPAQLTRQTLVTTAAGSGSAGYTAAQDGAAATAAQLNAPQGVALDALGNIYIADTANNRVRKVDGRTGIITTIAGSGVAGYRPADEGVVATFAQLNAPQDVAVDGKGNVLIADTGNHRIRRVSAATGLIVTLAGNGATNYVNGGGFTATMIPINQPTSLAVNPFNDLYVSDTANHVVLAISAGSYDESFVQNPGAQVKTGTYAGNNTPGYTTAGAEENVNPQTAHLTSPRGLAFDRQGFLLIADTGSNRLRRVSISGQNVLINTVAGNGSAYSAATEGTLATNAGIGAVSAIKVDIANNYYIGLSGSNRLLKKSVVDSKLQTYAGDGTAAFADNTLPSTSEFRAPAGIAVSGNGTLYVADTGNNRVRSLAVTTGNVIFPRVATGSSDASQAAIFSANANLTITSIKVLTPTGKTAEYVAGTPTGCGVGAAMTAGAVCAIPVTFTPAGPGRRSAPLEIVTSVGTQRFGLSGVGIAPLVVYGQQTAAPYAGAASGSYTPSEDNGPATAAHFTSIDYLSVDASDNLYVADNYAGRIRKVDSGTGIVSTVAGGGAAAYTAADEGKPAKTVYLSSPYASAVDAAGNLFIQENTGRVRRVDAVSGAITTIAGNGNSSNNPPADGVPATSTQGFSFSSLIVDQQGNVWQGDGNTLKNFRRVDAATGYTNTISLSCASCTGRLAVDENGTAYVAGTTVYRANTMLLSSTVLPAVPFTNYPSVVDFSPGGDLLLTTFNTVNYIPYGVTYLYSVVTGASSIAATYTGIPSLLDSTGNAYYRNGGTYQIGKTNSQSVKLAYAGTTVVGQASSDSPKTLTAFNIGSAPLTFPTPAAGLNPSLTSDFQITNSSTCPQISAVSAPATLAAGTGCSYSINFIPVAPGSVAGQMVFTDNQFGSATPITQTSTLTGLASGTAVTTSLGLTGLANTTAGTAQTVTVTAYSGSDQTHIATNYVGTVTFTSNDAKTGVLPAPYTFVAADNGVHTFTVTLKTAGSSQSVGVTDNANSALVAGKTVTVAAAAVSSITATSGTPQSVNTNAQGNLIGATVKDVYGNGVPNVTITFTVPATGASATLSTPSSVTDSLGQGQVGITANGTAGTYSIVASITAITGTAQFQITNTAPVAGFTVSGSSTTFGYGPDLRLTANITPSTINGHAPTGSVTFYEGATALSTQTVNLANGAPTYLVPAPSLGSHTYSASYTGDGVYPATARGASTTPLTVTQSEALINIPFTQTVMRPGTFAVSVGNSNGAASSTKAYTQPTGVLNYTISAACGNGGALSGSIALTNGNGVFTVPADCPARGYDISYTYPGDSNYTTDTHTRNTALTVTAPTATVSITNTDQDYDGAPKPVTVTTTPAGLSYSVGYGGSPSGPPTLAGSYPVHVVITDPNYTGTGDATLIVRRGPVGISWPLLDPIVYGTALSTTQLSATTTAMGTFGYNPVAGTVLTPGTYSLGVTFTPADSPSTPTSASQTLRVDRAPLLVTAVDAGRMYNTANPAFSANLTGVVNGDTFTTNGTTTATASSPVGTYPITPSVAGANLAYYIVTPQNGTLTVTGAPATVTLGALNAVYDGASKTVTVTTSPAGLATAVTYNGNSTAPTLPGNYSVVATVTDTNYTGTANGVLVITNGTATVTWATPAAITYGTPLSSTQLNAVATGAVGSFAYTPGAGVVLLPGVQTLTAVFTPTGGGTPTTSTVSLTVNKAPLTLKANNASRLLGVVNPPLTAAITGAVNGDVLTATATTTATAASPVGTYVIVPTVSGTNAAAYTVTATNGTLTVAPGASSVALASSAATSYVGDTITFTATVSGVSLPPSGTVEFFNGTTSLGVKTLSGGAAAVSTGSLAAGTYGITAVYSGDANYAAATSAVLAQTIFTSDYTIAVNPTVLTIRRGQIGTAVFTVTPIGNFHDTINFACNTLPAHVTCAFAPSSLTPNGGPVTTTVTINTGAGTASLERFSPWGASSTGIAMAGTIGLMLGLRRRRLAIKLLLLCLFSLATIAGITGCGGSAASTTATTGSYSVGVSAGVSTGTGASHAVSLAVNIID